MNMWDLKFVDAGWDDYLYWQGEDKKVLKKINDLIKDTRRHPFEGIGKPEPLRYQGQGAWSRRITGEHRLIYLPENGCVNIIAARYHY